MKRSASEWRTVMDAARSRHAHSTRAELLDGIALLDALGIYYREELEAVTADWQRIEDHRLNMIENVLYYTAERDALKPDAEHGKKFNNNGKPKGSVGALNKWVAKQLRANPKATTPQLRAKFSRNPPKGYAVSGPHGDVKTWKIIASDGTRTGARRFANVVSEIKRQ